MSLDNKTCKSCGDKYHLCKSCGHLEYDWLYLGFCSEKCQQKFEMDGAIKELDKFRENLKVGR